jgi:multisubunit Na+/H+ antiporter MnhB subunit
MYPDRVPEDHANPPVSESSQSGADEVRGARKMLVVGMAGQWGLGLFIFAVLNCWSASGNEADRKATHVSAWTAYKAWVVSLDSSTGYAWMGMAAVLLIAMAVGAPRPREIDTKLFTRFEEIDINLRAGVLAIGTFSVVVGAAMCAGAILQRSPVAVPKANSSAGSVNLPNSGQADMLVVVAVMSVLAVTFVAAAMTLPLRGMSPSLRAAYTHIEDTDLDRLDSLLRSLGKAGTSPVVRRHPWQLFWPTALVTVTAAVGTSVAVSVLTATEVTHRHRWWALVLLVMVATVGYIRVSAAIYGKCWARPRDLLVAGELGFLYVGVASTPLFLLGNYRIAIFSGSILTIPALLGFLVVWLPAARPWPAPVAAYGLIKAIGGNRRGTTAKVRYLDELRRTAWMYAEVAARSRRRFEAVRAEGECRELSRPSAATGVGVGQSY